MSNRFWSLVTVVGFSLILVACGGNQQQPISSTSVPPEAINPDCPYTLPWDAKGDKEVSQSINSNFSHQSGTTDAYAIDFALPEGTPIFATRDGVVSKIHDGETVSGGREYINNANFVIVDHGDGYFSVYLHLKAGIVVKEGQPVKRGEVIAYSGNTGFSDGPHLHFQVQKVGNRVSQSAPFCFSDVPGGVPSKGTLLLPGEKPPSISGEISGVATVSPGSADPWEIMNLECEMFHFTINTSIPQTIFEYFRDLWRSAGEIPYPEPQSFMDMEVRIGYAPPLHYYYWVENQPPSCAYAEIPKPDGTWVVYRTKGGEVKKFLEEGSQNPNPTAGLESLVGKWRGSFTEKRNGEPFGGGVYEITFQKEGGTYTATLHRDGTDFIINSVPFDHMLGEAFCFVAIAGDGVTLWGTYCFTPISDGVIQLQGDELGTKSTGTLDRVK